jgi:hypothetical protein
MKKSLKLEGCHMNWWKNASYDEATLGMLVRAKTNMEDADFWIVRKGSESSVGEPVREFNKEHIGVKVLRTDLLLPDYARWLVHYGWMRGWFRSRATGSLRLKNIKVKDVEEMPLPKRASSACLVKTAEEGMASTKLETTIFYGREQPIDWVKTNNSHLARWVGNRWEADVDINWLRTENWPFWMIVRVKVKSFRSGDGKTQELDEEIKGLIEQSVRKARKGPLVGAWRDQEAYDVELGRHRRKIFYSMADCSQHAVMSLLNDIMRNLEERHNYHDEDISIIAQELIYASELASHRMKTRGGCDLLMQVLRNVHKKPYLFPHLIAASDDPESEKTMRLFSSFGKTNWDER